MKLALKKTRQLLSARKVKHQKKQLVLLITFGVDQPQFQQEPINSKNTNNNQTSDSIKPVSVDLITTISKPNPLARLGRKFAKDKVQNVDII